MGASFRSFDAPITVRTGTERATLVRRTYSLVFVSVLITMVGVWFGLSTPGVKEWVFAHPIITMLATFAPLLLALNLRDAFPANIGLVLLFTFIEGVAISPIMAIYGQNSPGVITQAGVLTGSTFGVLTLYAWFSKRDFSAMGAFFTMGLWVLIVASLINLFVKSAGASIWLSAMTVLIFGGLLIYDTWRLRNVYGPNDYVRAAVNIYLDLLNMFLAILNLLGRRR